VRREFNELETPRAQFRAERVNRLPVAPLSRLPRNRSARRIAHDPCRAHHRSFM